MSWIQIEFNHIWNRRPHSHDSSIRITILIFMCQNESWKKNVSVCLGFPVIGYACQVQEVQPTEVKGYNVQLIGCENDTARVHPSTVISLGQSTESSPTVFRKWYTYNQSHMLINVTSHMKLVVFFPTYMTMINSRLMTKISYDYSNTNVWRTMNKESNLTDMSLCNWILCYFRIIFLSYCAKFQWSYNQLWHNLYTA